MPSNCSFWLSETKSFHKALLQTYIAEIVVKLDGWIALYILSMLKYLFKRIQHCDKKQNQVISRLSYSNNHSRLKETKPNCTSQFRKFVNMALIIQCYFLFWNIRVKRHVWTSAADNHTAFCKENVSVSPLFCHLFWSYRAWRIAAKL